MCEMTWAHDQDTRRMAVFHDVGHGGSYEGLAHAHLADTHHVILVTQRFHSPLDRIRLSLKRLSQKPIHAGVPIVAGFEKGLRFGLYLVCQSPAKSLQISVHIANGFRACAPPLLSKLICPASTPSEIIPSTLDSLTETSTTFIVPDIGRMRSRSFSCSQIHAAHSGIRGEDRCAST